MQLFFLEKPPMGSKSFCMNLRVASTLYFVKLLDLFMQVEANTIEDQYNKSYRIVCYWISSICDLLSYKEFLNFINMS